MWQDTTELNIDVTAAYVTQTNMNATLPMYWGNYVHLCATYEVSGIKDVTNSTVYI